MTVKTHEWDRFSLSSVFNPRFSEDSSRTSFFLFSEKLAYKAHENLSLGVNYTHIGLELQNAAKQSEFFEQDRLEFELNPHWKLTEWLHVKNRNRVEFRWIENRGSDNTRFRQLWELSFPVKDALPIKGFYMSNEYFYDAAAHDINENRAIPIGVDLRLNDKASLKVYYMVQSRKGPEDWFSNQILGTSLTVSF